MPLIEDNMPVHDNTGDGSEPQGRVPLAVLMTDVVGSTPLYERVGDIAALQQVADCLDSMRQIAVRHGGDFIRSRGDDVLCVFEKPEAALTAAIQMHEQLANRSLAIRLGLNYGLVIQARDDVFGDVVNVTARLAATANPGEILIGERFVDALPMESRKMVRLLDKMSFKGKQESFEVYTLVSEDQSLYTEVLTKPIVAEHPGPQPSINLVIRYAEHVKFCRDKETLTIGRSSQCDIVVQRPWVSRHHATLTLSNGRARLAERSSSGTFVSIGSDHEVFVRREDVLLFGSGIISPGRRSSLDDAQILHYEVLPV